ncbi:MAG: hypothetical protein JRJ60_09200 [Deltaproteobacteria bacterium]|nr:hypothetical protein [Deltaproteobacteria bacterium]
MRKGEPSIGRMLVDSLTSEQIVRLLDILSANVDLKAYVDQFDKSDPDMARTVKRVMAIPQQAVSGSKTMRIASLQRTMELWSSLWRNYEDLICEVGDEEGKYAFQDHHWEPPYFDGLSLARDLDRIGEDMLKLIDDVYEEIGDPDLFFRALEEIDDRIDSYPEWMGLEHGEPCILGEKITLCILEWLWLPVKRNKRPGSTFAERVFDIENAYDMVVLDGNAVIAYFNKLPEEVCREIYEFLEVGDLAVDLEEAFAADCSRSGRRP